MFVKVFLKETAMPLTYAEVVNTYTKGGLYCIMTRDRTVHKYPVANIWRVEEVEGGQ